MKQKRVFDMVACMLALGLAVQASAADRGRVVRSVAFPGMGQLGDNQTARGLLYMVGEVALLSVAVDQIVRKAAYDRATEYDSVRVQLAQTYEDKQYYLDDWTDMKEKSDRAALFSYVFGGAAAVWWAWNIVDALLFEPKDKEEALLYETIKDNTQLSFGRDKAAISYRINF